LEDPKDGKTVSQLRELVTGVASIYPRREFALRSSNYEKE